MKNMLSAMLALVVLFCISGVASAGELSSSVVRFGGTPGSYQIDFSFAKTVGNHTYVPINMNDTTASDQYALILSILDNFEKKNPRLEITSWMVEERIQQSGYTKLSYLFGIWINHRQR